MVYEGDVVWLSFKPGCQALTAYQLFPWPVLIRRRYDLYDRKRRAIDNECDSSVTAGDGAPLTGEGTYSGGSDKYTDSRYDN